MSTRVTIAFFVIIIFNAMVLGHSVGQVLTKKETAEPCVQALEEIAEYVNERIEQE